MKMEPLSPALGARVDGLDLTRVSDDLVGALREALLDRHVLAISGQSLSAADLQAFGERWGELLTHPSGMNKGSPYVQTLASRNGVVGRGYSAWHSDMTWHPTPPCITMLHGRICPAWGGGTGYANQVKALEALDKAAEDQTRAFRRGLSTRAELAGLRARHSGRRFGEDVPESVHPVVRTNDESGKQALFVNPEFTVAIEGLDEAESSRILWPLWMHATSMEFVYRHRWTAGDLVIWDNRSVMHTAILDYDSERFMQRVVVKGTVPV
jgi:taurine dioxygenase